MFLLIDKPKGITSHDVVDYVRKVTEERRVGHSGTLDPNATGLLIVAVGRESTKKLADFSGKNKEYEAEIFLGEERETDDSEGEIVEKRTDFSVPKREKVEEILKSFVGDVFQVPPKYSAKKIRGKKAYELARKGKKINLKPQKVTIYSIEVINYKYPVLKILVKVSKGTYIRAIARDIGREIGSGAYLKELRRTKIGEFDIQEAVFLKKLKKQNWKKFVLKEALL